MPKTTQRPDWAPLARLLVRRLRQAEADNTFDLDINEDGEGIGPAEPRTRPSVVELLDELELSQRRDSRDLEAMRAAGTDGWALDESGADRPAQAIAPGKILTALQLAATFGTERAFLETLRRDSVTVVEGIPPAQLAGAATSIGRLLLPKGWAAQTRAPRAAKGGILQLLRPTDGTHGRVSETAVSRLETETLAALALPHALMILLPAGVRLPAQLARVLPPAIRFAEVDREILLALLGQTHSSTGKIDRAHVRPLLPRNADLADLDMLGVLAALRAPDAAAAARALTEILAPAGAEPDVMTLEQIGGDGPAHRAATALVADLSAWRRGEAEWGELSHSLLLSGPPGTGKSVLARGIAASAGVPLIETSFGTWQSFGHLGDMLREMRRSFNDSLRKKPSVLFIDEIDAAGSRDSADRHGSSYRAQVINQFLAEIDQLQRAEGVVLIGATNHGDALDPAIVRAGRFDLHCSLDRPSLAQIQHMLARAMPDASGDQLAELTRHFAGDTPATIDAALRAAKSAARREGRPFDPVRLLSECSGQRHAYDRRAAIHESGHAIVATILGAGPVRRMQLSSEGGTTSRGTAITEGTAPEFEAELAILLAGRAAERLLLGNISAGAGGGESSDLAVAAALHLRFDREFGLGVHGNAWLGPANIQRLGPDVANRLRVRLDRFERRASALLEPHRDLLERLATHLVDRRDLGQADLHPWLAGIPVDKTAGTPA